MFKCSRVGETQVPALESLHGSSLFTAALLSDVTSLLVFPFFFNNAVVELQGEQCHPLDYPFVTWGLEAELNWGSFSELGLPCNVMMLLHPYQNSPFFLSLSSYCNYYGYLNFDCSQSFSRASWNQWKHLKIFRWILSAVSLTLASKRHTFVEIWGWIFPFLMKDLGICSNYSMYSPLFLLIRLFVFNLLVSV